MRILVTGSSGFLGSYVEKRCRLEGIDVFGASSRDRENSIDISDDGQMQKMIEKIKPDCIINCAAMTDVDQCERQPDKAHRVNATGPQNLAKACREKNIRLVHVSTDAVFDGERGGYSEDSVTSPVNVYARTKLEGEQLIAANISDYVLARVNFYGLNEKGKGLLNWALASLVGEKEMTGFDDVIFNPLWAADLAECLVKLSQMSYSGILNCAGDQVMSKYDFLKAVAHTLGYREAKINRSASDKSALYARRPKKTYLLNKKMHELLNTKIHTLEEVLCDPSFDIYRTNAP